MKYQRVLMWFRQDLRVQDNTALIEAVADAKDIIPVFIMDTQILARSPAGDRRIGFLLDAVKQLDTALQALGSKLYVYHGRSQELIPLLVKQWGVDAVYANRSYGHGSGTRDTDIQSSCDVMSVRFCLFSDYLLVEPQDVPTRKVFTPFYKLRQQIPKRSVQPMIDRIQTVQMSGNGTQESVTHINLVTAKPEDFGGSTNLHRPIDHIEQHMSTFDYDGYDDTRNIPSIDGSSRLSPYLKFGLISIRQLYELSTQVTSQVYTSELARREFWQHIMHRFPQTLEIEFQEKRRNLSRENDEVLIQARKDGKTGYPIVDAGMRQLREQNRIHNRVRMVVASFLTKDLLVDRRIGEQHFAEYLIDYDRNVNIGNRQRSASVGADPKPLRIFSPILQAQRFDPNASYIKRRIPELAGVDAVSICDPVKSDLYLLTGGAYPRPVVDHATNSRRAKEMYRNGKL